MAAVQVSLPSVLTSPEPAASYNCEGTTVTDALRAAVRQAPQYAARVYHGDRLLVGVVLNGRHLPPAAAAATPLSAGDHIEVIPPVAGG